MSSISLGSSTPFLTSSSPPSTFSLSSLYSSMVSMLSTTTPVSTPFSISSSSVDSDSIFLLTTIPRGQYTTLLLCMHALQYDLIKTKSNISLKDSALTQSLEEVRILTSMLAVRDKCIGALQLSLSVAEDQLRSQHSTVTTPNQPQVPLPQSSSLVPAPSPTTQSQPSSLVPASLSSIQSYHTIFPPLSDTSPVAEEDAQSWHTTDQWWETTTDSSQATSHQPQAVFPSSAPCWSDKVRQWIHGERGDNI